MAKYTVDVKAFINVTLEANNPTQARIFAECLIGELAPTASFVEGYNQGQLPARILDVGEFDIDGTSEVELVDQEDDA